LFDINGDSVVSEQDRDMLFHIWKFLDTRDLSHADINNDGIISNLDVSTLNTRLAAGTQDMGMDINGDDLVNNFDLLMLTNLVNNYMNTQISFADLRRSDIDANGLVDAEDQTLFEASFQKISQLDVNRDGVITNGEISAINDALGLVIGRRVFKSEIVSRADLNGDTKVDFADQDILNKSMQRIAGLYDPQNENVDQAFTKIESIIEFLKLRRASELRTNADTDQNGVASAAELDALRASLLAQGFTFSEVNDTMADVNRVLSESEKHLGDIDGDSDIDMIDRGLLEDGRTNAAKYDIDGNGTNNQADVDALIDVLNAISTGAIPNYVFDGDLNKDLSIDSEDLQLMIDSLPKAKDINGDGHVDAADQVRIQQLAAFDLNAITTAEIVRADVDGNGELNDDDIKALQDAVNNIARYDVDGNHLFEPRDVKLVEEMVTKHITANVLHKSDINKDGRVDRQDVRALQEALGRSVDVNSDGGIDANDVYRIDEVMTWNRINPKSSELTDADINHDGLIDQNDFNAFLEVLNRIPSDFNGDGRMDGADVDELKEIISRMGAAGITVAMFEKADIDGNGVINAEDISQVEAASKVVRDVDGNGVVNALDLKRLQDLMEYQSLQTDLRAQAIRQMDLTGDSLVNADDLTKLRDWIKTPNLLTEFQKHKADLTGNGTVDAADADYLNAVLEILKMDLDGDFKVDRSDMTALAAKISEYQSILVQYDLKADGKIDDGDVTEWNRLRDLFVQLPNPGRFDLNADGRINRDDETLMADYLSGKKAVTPDIFDKLDLDGDHKVLTQDMILLQSAAAIFRADFDGNKNVDSADLALLNDPVQGAVKRLADLLARYDYNKDGLLSTPDRNPLADQIRNYLSFVKPYGVGDINRDGVISEAERDAMLTTITHYVDLNGVPGVDQGDVTLLERVLAYQRLNVSEADKNIADIDRDGDVDNQDLTQIQEGLTLLKQADINQDGKLNDQDQVRINEILAFLQTHPIEQWPYGLQDIRIADVNRDGKVDNKDSGVISDFITGKYDINRDGVLTPDDVARFTNIIKFFELKLTPADFIRADMDGNGILDNHDLEIFNEFLPRFKRGDMNGDGKVDQADYTIMQDVVRFLDVQSFGFKQINGRDIDGDGVVDIFQAVSPLNRADINGDGKITIEDRNEIEQMIKSFIDINGDGKIDQEDLARIPEIIEGLSLDTSRYNLTKADMNGDGIIDGRDITMLDDQLMILRSYDLNQDGKTDTKDIQFVKDIFDVASSAPFTIEQLRQADLNGDGIIDEKDKNAINEVLSKLRDVNHDGNVDMNDVKRLEELTELITLDLKAFEISNADIDGNGFVNEYDKLLLQQSMALFNHADQLDVNHDGKINEQDVREVQNILAAILRQEQIPLEELTRRDVNGDGRVDDKDVQEVLKILNAHVDVNGDGIINDYDIQRIWDVQKYLSYNIKPAEMALADVNRDGKVDTFDVVELRRLLSIYKKGDFDGNKVVDAKDLELLSKTVAFLEVHDPALPTLVLRADLDRSGLVDANDREQLSRILSYRVDLNGDGKVDKDDIDYLYLIIDALQAGIANPEKDINGDGKVDDEDVDALQKSLDFFKQFDVNKDGVVDKRDIDLLTDVMTYSSAQGAVYAEEFRRADLNGDGKVDGQDLVILQQGVGGWSVRKNAIETEDRFALTPSGTTLYTATRNAFANYKMTTQDTGIYEIGLSVKTWDNLTPPDNYLYQFDLYIDGAYQGHIEISPSRTAFTEGFLKLNVGPGEHEVRYVWTNGGGPINVQIKEVFMRNILDIADAKGTASGSNGVIDEKDIALLEHVRQWFPKIDMNGDGWFHLDDAEMYSLEVAQLRVVLGVDALGHLDLSKAEDAQALLKRYDLDEDGRITWADEEKMETINFSIHQVDRLVKADMDGNGRVTQEDVKALEQWMRELVDVNQDGVVDDKDVFQVQQVIDFNLLHIKPEETERADLNGDGVVDHRDADILRLDLQIFRGYDVNKDGVTDQLDANELASITEFFKTDRARLGLADLNKDGLIDQEDVRLLSDSFFHGVDLNDDGRIDSKDVDILQELKNRGIFNQTADIYPLDLPDGRITQDDVEALKNAVRYHVDVNGDGMVDVIDLAFARLEIDLALYDKADLNQDGEVTAADYQAILKNFRRLDAVRDGRIDSKDNDQFAQAIEIVKNRDLSRGAFTETELLAALALLNPERVSDSSLVSHFVLDGSFDEAAFRNLFSSLSGSWEWQGRELIQKDTRDAAVNRLGALDWRDVVFGIDLEFSSYEHNAGLRVRMQDENNYYEAVLADDRIQLALVRNEIRTVLAEKMLSEVDIQPLANGQRYRLEIHAEGEKLTVSINGREALSAEDDSLQSGTAALFTENSVVRFSNLSLSADADLAYLRDLYVLDRDLNQDGTIDAKDYSLLSAIYDLGLTDIDGDGEINPADRELLRAIALVDFDGNGKIETADLQAFKNQSFDMNGDAQMDERDLGMIESWTHLADAVQRETFRMLSEADFDHSGVVGWNDLTEAKLLLWRYFDFNNDGQVDADDISRLEQVVEARRMFLGNVNLDELLKRVDFNKDGRVDGADQTILEQNVAQFSVVDVTGDGKLDQQDLDRLKTVLDLVKVIQQIQPSSIITRDLNGDNIIDQRDVALEYLNALVDVNGDGKADAGMLDALLADVRKIQTFQPPVESWDPADLNNDRKVDIQDVRKFLENLGSYVFKDLNKDGQENSKDLEIAKRLIDYVYQNANYSPETLVLADLNQDGRVDSQDAAIADAFLDLDGDGAVNEQDVALAQYLVFRGKIGQGDLNLVRR
ncbi:MAG: hypothetical protein HYZ84_07375, partial [Candidatus Omnitrophica bacterium]|nr:hypothetical protein [Candidatus Omnitrophota bacterium]